jgi:CBS domain-containing protein
MIPLLREARKLILEGLAQPRDIDDCCRIGTEVMAALSEACIRLAHKNVTAAGIDPPRTPYCWLLFGESARCDLLEPQLPTIAAVYDDSKEGLRSEDSMYFTALAGDTLAWFQECGLSGPGLDWPEGSQPCMPLSEWRRLYRETVRNPLGHNLYLRREFFDLRVLSGDEAIRQKLEDQILLELQDHAMSIPLLANDTLANLPPLTFFHGLVLESDGTPQESFDIDRVAVSPIADAARVHAIAGRRLAPANTLERLHSAALDCPEGADILRGAADAFRIALYYRAVAGPRIQPGKLRKFDQRLLKTAFSAIHRLLEFTALRFVPDA